MSRLIGWTRADVASDVEERSRTARSRPLGVRGLALIALTIGLMIPLLGEAQETQPQPLGEGQTPQVGAQSRADSLRALAFERLRAPQEPQELEGDADEIEGGEDLEPAPATVTLSGSASSQSGQASQMTVPDGADPFMEGLLKLEGATVSAYEGTRVDFEIPRRNLILWGDEERGSRFMGVGMELSADSSITYDGLLGMIRTRGAAEFIPENGAPVATHRLVYSLNEDRGTALQAETDYSDGGVSWIVRGDLDSVRDGELFASSTIFTSCDLDHPHSYFMADRIKILADQIMVTGPVKLYFDDVPVLWLPFFVQNLGSGRSSGLLTPVFSVNDIVSSSSGYNRRVGNLGYYWAMSDYSDMTIAADWYSNQFIAMESRLGYRWAQRFLSGTVNFKHYWRDSGRRDLALNTRHEWAVSERTNLSVSGNYVSSSELVLQNSLDPRELTQTIDSDGKLSRRFDWGTVTLGASRKQYLSEERTDMTLPSLGLSLSTLTLFGAPPQTARWYNNISFSGGGNASRKQLDRAFQPDTTFTFLRASQLLSEGSVRGTLGIGDLSLSASGSYDEDLFRDVPLDREVEGSPRGDFRATTASWSAGVSYRLRLIGSTTLSPGFNVGASLLQVDSIPEAAQLVQGPLRTSVGVGLQTEIYGFFGGFGPLEAIRHKISPSVNWTYSPEVVSTELQQTVFGAGVSRRVNMLTLSLNQTWEGKLRETSNGAEAAGAPGAVAAGAQGVGGGVIQGAGVEGAEGGLAVVDTLAGEAELSEELEGGPTRLPPSRTRMILALSTGGISYDMVRADSMQCFVCGFLTTSISTTINSDYLRGLNLSFTHDLFDDTDFLTEGLRSFDPHLSQLSLGFGLSNESGIIRAITRLLGGTPGEVQAGPSPVEPVTPFGGPPSGVDPFTGYDPNRVIPGTNSYSQAPTRRQGWDAQVSYSLRRPRKTDFPVNQGLQAYQEPTAQMISTTFSFSPTELWNVGWVTSYDVEAKKFSDHVVRLTRDLHEWDASFGFRQTAMGNWSFQFEVALKANRDLRFDYEQRSLPGQVGF